MRKIVLIIGFTIGTIMLVLTVIGVSSISRVLYSNSSASYLTQISQINIICSMLFLILYLVGLFLYGRKQKILHRIILLFSFIFWVLSGRTVGLTYFPNGEVISGYYYLTFDKFEISKTSQDYEKIISIETEINVLPLWRINIKNENINRTIFLGPFVWNSASKILMDKIGKYHLSSI